MKLGKFILGFVAMLGLVDMTVQGLTHGAVKPIQLTLHAIFGASHER